MNISKLTTSEFIEKLKRLQLMSMDADGTLTNGEIYIDNQGNQMRSFCAHDGVGTRLLQEIGIHIVLLTTSKEKVFSIRSDIINCNDYIPGSLNKGDDLEKLCTTLNISLKNVMHVGDDINDISAFLKVGFPVAVNNAGDEVKKVCRYITKKNGGQGAIRELCDLIMIAKTGKAFGMPYVNSEIQNILK